MTPTAQKLQKAIPIVKDQASFVQELLVGALGWPIEGGIEDLEDISYLWTSDELQVEGLDERIRDGRVWQVQPLLANQPWGVFVLQFANPDVFVKGRGMTGLLRKVLRNLVPRRQRSSDLPAWNRDDLLFICTHAWQYYSFVHFSQPGDRGCLARLTSFGWTPESSNRTLLEHNLPYLEWPEDPNNPDAWRKQWLHAFDKEKLTERYFKALKDIYEKSIVPDLKKVLRDEEDAKRAGLLLLNRLLFLCFIQKKGWLAKSAGYLFAAFEEHRENPDDMTYYMDFLSRLFQALSPPVQDREDSCFPDIPFLNGGLFDPNTGIADADLRITNKTFARIFDELLERYNFTVTEDTPLDIEVAVDPEMLGKIFEELITERNDTGAYYTPRPIVAFMCREALKGCLGGHAELVDEHTAEDITLAEARELLVKLEAVKVVDPACGSGAYLVAMLHELHELIRLLDTRAGKLTARDEYERKLQIIHNNIYGVDIDPVAVHIARLRLWLSLAVDYEGAEPEPLPNLDFKIEEGDSLTTPDPSIVVAPHTQVVFRDRLVSQFDELKAAYQQTSLSTDKERLREKIGAVRRQIVEWMHPGQEVTGFDWRVEFAEVFTRKDAPGFDVVLANPPYGASVRDDVRNQYFNRRTEGAQSKDTYGLFIARALQLLRPGGQFSFIISDTWRTIRTHLPLRKRLLEQSTVAHLLDLPPWVFKSTVNTCILTVAKGSPPEGHELIAGDLHNLERGDWVRLEQNLAAVAAHGPDVQTTTYARYTYRQCLIATYENCSFFIGSPKLYRLMSDDGLVRLGCVADVKVGLQTGDNDYYIRKRPAARGNYQILDESKLLTEREIANLTGDEKRNGVDPRRYAGRHFIPYDKGGESDAEGGWLPNYCVPTQYFIDWSKQAVRRLRTATIAEVKRRRGEADKVIDDDDAKQAAVIRNSQYYFRPGLTFSDTGMYSPTFRLSAGCVFDQKGSIIIPQDPDTRDVILGLLCSTWARYVYKVFVNHTVSSHVDSIKEFPSIQNLLDLTHLSQLVQQVVAEQKADRLYPYYLYEQKEIDAEVYELYGLTEENTREVDLWYSRRYPRLAEASGVLNQVKEKYADHLARCERIISKPPGYWKSHPILELIAQGEGAKLEFKETLEADAKTGEKSLGVLVSSLKTVAGFLNSEGGILLVGVSDSGEIKGLERDYRLCQRHNADGLEQKLRSLLQSRFDPAPLGKVTVEFEILPEGHVCRVAVAPSSEIVHLDGKDLFVRDGNTTRKLEGRALTDWVEHRSKS
ncbi:MAG: N-6 DNA methylase [bacterium]|nr:N-6 DNA methylase [bacterium]